MPAVMAVDVFGFTNNSFMLVPTLSKPVHFAYKVGRDAGHHRALSWGSASGAPGTRVA
jgi:(p)ppGpp synthase/HD superfamily hydrolase